MMYTAALLTLVCASCVLSTHHDPALESVVGEELLEVQDQIKAAVAHDAGTDAEQANSMIDGDEMLPSVAIAEIIRQAYGTRKKRTLYNFDIYPENRWPSDSIPYIFGYEFSDDQKDIIRSSLAAWSSRTCVQFVETPQDDPSLATTPHLSFKQGTDCISFVSHGENDKPQIIFLRDSCFSVMGNIAHEIGHALGLWHEHQRPDRDDFVSVITENIQEDEQGSFIVLPEFIINDLGHPYDYGSMTHFPATQYTRNSEYTMVPTDPLYTATIGQRVEPSFWDIKKINAGYCEDTCAGVELAVPCLHEGYQDPTDCTRCRCPDGYGGQYCQTLAAGVGATCGGEHQLQEGQEFTIESPNYGGTGRYAVNTECTWKITAPEGEQIRMWFGEIFEVFCRRGVAYHWVEIRYKDENIRGPRFCGTSRPMVELVSDGSEVMVIFKSNYDNENPDDPNTPSGQRRGFRLHLEIMSCGGCGMQAGEVQTPCDSKTDMDTIETTCYRYVTHTTHRGSWWFRRTVTETRLESYSCVEYIPIQYCCEGTELCRKTTGEYVCIRQGWMDWCDCTASCGNCGTQWRKCWAYSRCLPFQIGFETRFCDPAPCTDCADQTRCETPCCYGNVLNEDGDMCIAG